MNLETIFSGTNHTVMLSMPGASSPEKKNELIDKILSQIAQLSINPTTEPAPFRGTPLSAAWIAMQRANHYVEQEYNRPDGTQYKSSMNIYQASMKSGRPAEKMDLIAKAIHKAPNSQIIHDICGCHIQATDTILEVGAGTLLGNADTSYLTSHFPDALKKNVTYSDANTMFLNPANNVPYKLAKMESLSETFGCETFDHIVAANAFDTVRVPEIPQAFRQAYKVLKPGGKLMLFSTHHPLLNNLFAQYSAFEELISFPLLDSRCNFKGLQILTREYLTAWVENNTKKGIHVEESKFFEAVLKLNAPQRDRLLFELATSKDNGSISDFIAETFGKALEVILNEDFYKKNMRQGLEDAGFKIKDFELKSASTVINASDLPINNDNCFCLHERRDYTGSYRSYAIPNDVKIIRSKMHVIVAKKPED